VIVSKYFIYAAVALLALCFVADASAGPLRRLLRRGKAAVKKVAPPYRSNGCAGGVCR
jgi:hypothetical protein